MAIFGVIDTADGGDTGYEGFVKDAANWAIEEGRIGFTTVASAATTAPIWAAAGDVINYTGTATATDFPAAPQAGKQKFLICAGACVFTHAGNITVQGGATRTAVAGDVVTVTAITATTFRVNFIAQTETGTGATVRATSPTLVTPLLGTPTSGTLTNCLGLPTGGVTMAATAKVLGRATAGAGVAEELATTGTGSVVLATSPTLVTPALGTPASGTLTSCTGLPAAGVVGTAIVNSGALGTPASGTLTSCTGLPLAGLAVGTAESDFICATTNPFTWVKKTLVEAKALLGLVITAGKTITCTKDTSLDEAVAMSSKAPKASPVFTGSVTIPALLNNGNVAINASTPTDLGPIVGGIVTIRDTTNGGTVLALIEAGTVVIISQSGATTFTTTSPGASEIQLTTATSHLYALGGSGRSDAMIMVRILLAQ